MVEQMVDGSRRARRSFVFLREEACHTDVGQ
jgi:hypothetical protein